MKFKIFISIVIGIIIIFMLISLNFNKVEIIKPQFYLTTTELVDYFNLDEDLADKKFANKLIQIEGTIKNITYNNKKPTITFNATDDSGVICSLNSTEFNHTTKLQKNDKITIQGKCTGFLLDVIMADCIIIKKRKHEN